MPTYSIHLIANYLNSSKLSDTLIGPNSENKSSTVQFYTRIQLHDFLVKKVSDVISIRDGFSSIRTLGLILGLRTYRQYIRGLHLYVHSQRGLDGIHRALGDARYVWNKYMCGFRTLKLL